MLDDPIKYGLLGALAIALVYAAASDLKSRKLGNGLNLAIALGAPLFWWASEFSLYPDIAFQLALCAGTFAVLSIVWRLGGLGGGDVKMLTALALWIRPGWFLDLIVMMILAGGVLSVAVWIWHRLKQPGGRPRVPYGVAISFGGIWVISKFYLPASSLSSAAG